MTHVAHLQMTGRRANGRYAIVDAADYARCSLYRWTAVGMSWAWYARARIDGENVLLHRFLMGAKRGDGRLVDHRNGRGWDCRRANMRFATHSQNVCNARRRKPGEGAYRGVIFVSSRRFEARISRERIVHKLGFFDSPEAAARAYDAAARRLHGEFAVLNFPEARP